MLAYWRSDTFETMGKPTKVESLESTTSQHYCLVCTKESLLQAGFHPNKLSCLVPCEISRVRRKISSSKANSIYGYGLVKCPKHPVLSISQGLLVPDIDRNRILLVKETSANHASPCAEIRWSEASEKFMLQPASTSLSTGKGSGDIEHKVYMLLSAELGSREKLKLELHDCFAIGVNFFNDSASASSASKLDADGIVTFRVSSLGEGSERSSRDSIAPAMPPHRDYSDFLSIQKCQGKLKERFRKSLKCEAPREDVPVTAASVDLHVRIGGAQTLKGRVLPLKLNSAYSFHEQGCHLLPGVQVEERATEDAAAAEKSSKNASLELEVVKGPPGIMGKVFQIENDGATIGSNKSNTVFIDSNFVAPFHIRIEKTKSGEFWLNDLSTGARSGVLMERESFAFELERNDTIVVQNRLFHVRLANRMRGVNEKWVRMAIRISKKRKSFRYSSLPYQEIYVLVNDAEEVVIGRDPAACDIVLKDYTMQQYCAMFLQSEHRYFIVPMNSTQKKGIFLLLGRRTNNTTGMAEDKDIAPNKKIPRRLEDGDIFKIGRTLLRVIDKKTEQSKETKLANEDFLETVSLNADFAALAQYELKALAQASCLLSFNSGENILSQGQLGFGLYFVRSGKVKVIQNKEVAGKIELIELQRGDCFGESGLLYNDPAMASCEASGSQPVSCYFIHYHTLRACVTRSTLVRLWTVLERRQMTTYRFLLKQNAPFDKLSSAKLGYLCLQRNITWYNSGEELLKADGNNIWVTLFGKVEPLTKQVLFPEDRDGVVLRAATVTQILSIDHRMYDLVLKMTDEEVEQSVHNLDSSKEILLPMHDHPAEDEDDGLQPGQSLFNRVTWTTMSRLSTKSANSRRGPLAAGTGKAPLTRLKSSVGEGEEFTNIANMKESLGSQEDLSSGTRSQEGRRMSLSVGADFADNSILTQSDVEDDSDDSLDDGEIRAVPSSSEISKELQERLDATPFYLILEAVAGPQRGSHFLVDKPITIFGSEQHVQSSAQRSIKLNDKTLSRLNSMVEYRNGAFYLQDMGSKNGTFIKLKDGRDYKLEAGDILSVSDHEFQVFAQSIAAPSRRLTCCGIT